MTTHLSDVNQAAVILIIGFSIGFLGRRFVRLFKFFAERVLPTNFYYLLEFAMAFSVITLGGWVLIEIARWPGPAFAGVVMMALLLAGANTYYRLLRETGCPQCKNPRPFRRVEKQRRIIRTVEQKQVTRNYRRPYLSLRRPYFRWARSWDVTLTTVHQFSKARFRCASCKHEWETGESELISRLEAEQDLPPETNRRNGPGA